MDCFVGVRVWRVHVFACERDIESLEDGSQLQDCLLKFLLLLCLTCIMHVVVIAPHVVYFVHVVYCINLKDM